MCVLSCFSCVQLFPILWTVAHQDLCPWHFLGKNTGVRSHAFLQGIFPNKGWNSCLLSLLHWKADSLLPEPLGKSPKCRTWVQPQKRQNNLCSFPRQTIQHHINPSLCPNHWCWRRGWSWPVLWRPITPLELARKKKKKRCPFDHSRLEWKSRKLRDTWKTGKFGLGVKNEEGKG